MSLLNFFSVVRHKGRWAPEVKQEFYNLPSKETRYTSVCM